MEEKVAYWVELSDYDLETAQAMLEKCRFLYVGYMCHQAIEKIFKAIVTQVTGALPPYTHNLSHLAKAAELLDMLTEDQEAFLDLLEPLNIEARYPSHKERLLNSLTQEKCSQLIDKTRELQTWVKTKLSTN